MLFLYVSVIFYLIDAGPFFVITIQRWRSDGWIDNSRREAGWAPRSATSMDERALEIHQRVGRTEAQIHSNTVCTGMNAISNSTVNSGSKDCHGYEQTFTLCTTWLQAAARRITLCIGCFSWKTEMAFWPKYYKNRCGASRFTKLNLCGLCSTYILGHQKGISQFIVYLDPP